MPTVEATAKSNPIAEFLRRAGGWMLESGIQEESGGIARYYRIDLGRNNPLSTEITGYGVSGLCYLYQLTGERRYLDAALRAGRFLTRTVWDAEQGIFPFEWFPDAARTASTPAYFFDCGIIVRGLLYLWRMTGEQEFLRVARECGEGMAQRFPHNGQLTPILDMPGFVPRKFGETWSNNPGCYQLKSAMGWLDLFAETGERAFRRHFDQALEMALADGPGYLPGAAERARVMDRLHPFAYYLEALVAVAGEPGCADALRDGIEQLSHYLREIRGEFVRSDVYAQLLRVRLEANRLGVVALNRQAAEDEAEQLATFQYASSDPRLDGGFSFGRRGEAHLPYANPVSTLFCLQASAMWTMPDHEANQNWRNLI